MTKVQRGTILPPTFFRLIPETWVVSRQNVDRLKGHFDERASGEHGLSYQHRAEDYRKVIGGGFWREIALSKLQGMQNEVVARLSMLVVIREDALSENKGAGSIPEGAATQNEINTVMLLVNPLWKPV